VENTTSIFRLENKAKRAMFKKHAEIAASRKPGLDVSVWSPDAVNMSKERWKEVGVILLITPVGSLCAFF
jgi:hypothetical protein